MNFATCPECNGQVDLNSEIRYSPNRGADIFHAPCYIGRQRRAVGVALRSAKTALERTILSSINGTAEVNTESWNTLVRNDIAEIVAAMKRLLGE